MAIEWKQTPAYWYGGGAVPVDIHELCFHLYDEFDPATMGPFFQPGPSGNGWYVYAVGGQNVNKIASLVAESAPEAFVYQHDNDPLPSTRNLMGIYFPNAKRRWSMSMTITASGSNYTITLAGKWFNENNVEVNDVVDVPGRFSATAAWVKNTFGYPTPPGQFITGVVHNPDVTAYGFTYGGSYDYDGSRTYYQMNARMVNIIEWAAYLQQQNPTMDFGVWETEDESPEAGPSSEAGGYGGYGGNALISDSYALDPVPTASAASLGFINMYNPSAGGLASLGSEIFPEFDFDFVVDPTGIDIIDAILNAAGAFIDCINQFPKMFDVFMNSRLIDYVQDCHIVPVKPPVTTAAHIKLGYRELDTTAPVITSEYVVEDLGTIDLDEVFKSFLDYQPFTRAKLYLPFVGYTPLEPEYWQSGSLGVAYKFNVYDGSFTANVYVTPSRKCSEMYKTVIGVYTGTAIIHIPLTGLNYSSMVAGLIGGAGAMMSSIASGNPLAAAGAALNTATSSPQVMMSNSYTASAAFLGQRRPFLLIERTVSHYSELYQHDKGLPSYITTVLGNAKGFTRVKNVDTTLANFRATKEEKDEILKLLSEGIYI